MWRRQRRLWWTSGETPLTTPHWPSTVRLWRESAALNSWGCTSQRISPGPPTPCHSPRRHNSAYTFSAAELKRASLPPPILNTFYRGTIESVLTSCITVWYGNCSAADRRPSSGQWTRLQRSSVPSPIHLDIFLARCSAKPTASWRTPPTPPTVSSSSYHQEDGTGASEPAPPDCSTAFSPGCESPELKLPRPPLKPHAIPYLLKHGPSPPPSKHPPTLPHQRTKCKLFCAIQVCYTQVSGPVQTTCSNTLSSMH